MSIVTLRNKCFHSRVKKGQREPDFLPSVGPGAHTHDSDSSRLLWMMNLDFISCTFPTQETVQTYVHNINACV